MKIDLSELKTGKFWKEMAELVVGTFVAALAVYYFLLPSNLVLGSISGLAMVISTLFGNAGIVLKVSTIVLILNVLLLILAYIFLGKEVGFKTVVASVLLGPFMDLCEKILPYTKLIEPGMNSVMGDPVLDLLAFVLVLSASQAFLFRLNASTGGIDIVALIMKKYLHMEIGTAVTVSGMIVCCFAFLIHPFRMVAIGVIGTWLNGVIVDFFTMSLNKKKRVCIISNDHDQIKDYILNVLNRGCSLYSVEGGFSGEENKEIQVILTQTEFANLMEFIRKNDCHAFITAGNCSEIYGLWRKSEHHLHSFGGKTTSNPS